MAEPTDERGHESGDEPTLPAPSRASAVPPAAAGPDAHLRVSDAERDEVCRRLGDHAAEGRLTLQELEERIGRATSAVTRGDLAVLLHDLPDTARGGYAPAVPHYAADVPRRDGEAGRLLPTGAVVAVMSESRREGRWRMGDRVKAVAVMGSAVLDLRNAEIDDDTIEMVAVAVMGSVEIYAPDTVDVQVDDVNIMGSTEQRGSGRTPRRGAPVLRVRTVALMGSVEVWRLPVEASGVSLHDAKRAAKELEKRRAMLERGDA